MKVVSIKFMQKPNTGKLYSNKTYPFQNSVFAVLYTSFAIMSKYYTYKATTNVNHTVQEYEEVFLVFQ
jgi:hypothetical protein